MAQVTIVSNRLPVSVKKVDGKLRFYPSVGGLATGLISYTKSKNNKWIGWPGIVTDDLNEREIQKITDELAKHNCYPVFLTKNEIDSYYNGFSNEVLWPFFHNLRVKDLDQAHAWNVYRQVNKLFAQTALGLASPEGIIWVHDYQLLLVPEMIRKERSYDKIGFFLHIPFPEPAALQKLSHAKSILKGLLGADLVGFHTDNYVQDFLEACEKLQVGQHTQGGIMIGDRFVRVTDFPLGIDYDKYSAAGASSEVQKHIKKHRSKYGRRRKIILTFDRLDPTKGLVERLQAYKELLKKNKRVHKKVIMVMVATPSRTDIDAYKKLKVKVEKLVEDINNTFGKRNWQPIDYSYRTIPFEEVAALYRIADIAFIAPIKDGMNLVAKEYVASRADNKGVLILSETAGAAQELTEALLVNPLSPASLVKGLQDALDMREQELKNRLKDMKKQLSTYTIDHWKKEFMGSLAASGLNLQQRTKQLKGTELDQLLSDFAAAEHPAILLDYDGVLTQFVDLPSSAIPSIPTLKILEQLSARAHCDLLVISGRGKNDLEKWLGHLPMSLAAEHGSLLRTEGSKTWRKVIQMPSNWKKLILPVLQKYADKTPGAFVEEKDCSLTWHYRRASPYYAQKYTTIIDSALRPVLRSMGLGLYRGNMVLEVKSPEANKGLIVDSWLKKKHDFILAIGDDYTDEDMFAALPARARAVKVGRGKTVASLRLNNVDAVHDLLKSLIKLKR